MIALQLLRCYGSGTFHADYYYLPLAEFVDADRRHEMEELVIDRYNISERRSAFLMLAGLCPAFACVLVARKYFDRPKPNQKDG